LRLEKTLTLTLTLTLSRVQEREHLLGAAKGASPLHVAYSPMGRAARVRGDAKRRNACDKTVTGMMSHNPVMATCEAGF